MQRHNFFGHPPRRTWEGPKGQVSFNLHNKVISKILKPNCVTLCNLRNGWYKTYETGFFFGLLGHGALPQGV